MATNVTTLVFGAPPNDDAIRADIAALADLVADLAKVVNRLAAEGAALSVAAQAQTRLMLLGVAIGADAIAERYR